MIHLKCKSYYAIYVLTPSSCFPFYLHTRYQPKFWVWPTRLCVICLVFTSHLLLATPLQPFTLVLCAFCFLSLNEFFPDPYKLFYLPPWSLYSNGTFSKRSFPEQLILSNFLALTLSLAPAFIPLILTWYIIHLCLYRYILSFSYKIYISWKQEWGLIYSLMLCAIKVPTMGPQLKFGEIINKEISLNVLNIIDRLNLWWKMD